MVAACNTLVSSNLRLATEIENDSTLLLIYSLSKRYKHEFMVSSSSSNSSSTHFHLVIHGPF